MSQLALLQYPDPRLQLRSDPVTAFDASLARLVDDLFETLYATNSIGLSAPQANDRRQVLVIDVSGDSSAAQVYANPEILSRAMPGFVEERCLSVPGLVADVWRYTRVRVRAQDCSGKPFERDLTGMDAVCLQHEMDHLSGKLLVDRLTVIRRFLFRRRAAPEGAAGRLRRPWGAKQRLTGTSRN